MYIYPQLCVIVKFFRSGAPAIGMVLGKLF